MPAPIPRDPPVMIATFPANVAILEGEPMSSRCQHATGTVVREKDRTRHCGGFHGAKSCLNASPSAKHLMIGLGALHVIFEHIADSCSELIQAYDSERNFVSLG